MRAWVLDQQDWCQDASCELYIRTASLDLLVRSRMVSRNMDPFLGCNLGHVHVNRQLAGVAEVAVYSGLETLPPP